MFVGHYSAAFAVKAVEPRIPLWMLFIAAQLVDILWAPLVWLGIEQMHLDTTLLSNPLVLDHMPWTHSLWAALIWAGLAGAAIWHFKPELGRRAALFIGLTVFSHWILDLLVHRPDLAITSTWKVGLGLWNHPVAAYLLEICLLFAAAYWCAVKMDIHEQRQRVIQLACGLLIVQTAFSFAPVPASAAIITVSAFVLFLAFAWAARQFGPDKV